MVKEIFTVESVLQSGARILKAPFSSPQLIFMVIKFDVCVEPAFVCVCGARKRSVEVPLSVSVLSSVMLVWQEESSVIA